MMWSDWRDLEDNVKSIPETPGVYRIRCSKPNGKPMPIDRTMKSDKEGILDIGESMNLHGRINAFLRSARGGYGHSEGCTYFYYGYKRKFPVEYLEFQFIKTATKKKAKKKEHELLQKYVREFLDAPPLNSKRE